MNRKNNDLVEMDNYRPKVLLAGGLIGLGVGLLAAYLLVQRAEEGGKKPEMTVGEGVRLGVLVFGLLRQIGSL